MLTQSAGKPLDIVTAYFAISGYRLVKDGLHQVGAFRLLRGAKPHAGTDVGLRPNAQALKISSEETELSSCGTRVQFTRYPLFCAGVASFPHGGRDLLTGSEQVVYFCLLWKILRLANPPEFADAAIKHDLAGSA